MLKQNHAKINHKSETCMYIQVPPLAYYLITIHLNTRTGWFTGEVHHTQPPAVAGSTVIRIAMWRIFRISGHTGWMKDSYGPWPWRKVICLLFTFLPTDKRHFNHHTHNKSSNVFHMLTVFQVRHHAAISRLWQGIQHFCLKHHS